MVKKKYLAERYSDIGRPSIEILHDVLMYGEFFRVLAADPLGKPFQRDLGRT